MSSMVTRKRKLAESPLSMVHKSGQSLVVKSVVSGARIFGTKESGGNADAVSDDEDHGADASDSELWMEEMAIDMGLEAPPEDPALLPDCRVKRNYSCSQCSFFTQNPRKYLYHLRDDHAEKMKIYECKWCIYASKHSQKVQRHIRMCHGPGTTTPTTATAKTLKTRLSESSPAAESVGDSRLVQQQQDEKALHDDASRDSAVDTGCGSVSARSNEEEEEEEGDEQDRITEEEDSNEGNTEGMSYDSNDDGPESVMTEFVQAEIDEDQEEDEEEDDPKYETGLLPNDCEMGAKAEKQKQKSAPRRANKRGRGSGGGTNNGKKFFRCTTCNYVTNVKARFTKHVKYHSMPLIKCDYCDFKTPYKWNLDRHYKNHNGEGNLHCPLCNFTADIKQSLTVHVQNHHANVPTNSINDMIKQQIQLAAANELEKSDGGVAGMEAPYLTDSGEVISSELVGKAKIKITARKAIKKEPQGSDRHDFSSDFIHPDDILDKNGKIYIKKLKCKYCSYKAVWETDMNRHMTRTHGVILPKRRNSTNASPGKPRPMPNLIPIQTPAMVNAMCSSSKSRLGSHDISQRDIKPVIIKQEVNADSQLQFSKSSSGCGSSNGRIQVQDKDKKEGDDFRDKSLFLQSLALKPNVVYSLDSASESMGRVASGSRRASCSSVGGGRRLSGCGVDSSVSITPVLGPPSSKVSPTATVKPSTFYEELSQKLVACKNEPVSSSNTKNIVTITSNSTRCQFCRQRCKTSADLLMHLSSCADAQRDSDDSNGYSSPSDNKKSKKQLDGALKDEQEFDDDDQDNSSSNSSEHKIFVWNNSSSHGDNGEGEEEDDNIDEEEDDDDDDDDEDEDDYEIKGHFLDGTDEDLVGFETAPGIGAIHAGKLEELWGVGTEGYSPVSMIYSTDECESVTTTRKVYRCPQTNCGFWATTASRFHVHIVGHYNMKPFECSQCSYKSNWRWDITKHIKLKAMRDTAHHKAKVLLTHESGQRNYRKYDRYLQMMQLKHSADSKLPDCSTVASKRNDVETEVSPSSMTALPKVSPQSNGSGGSGTLPKLQMPKLTRAPFTQGGVSPASSVQSEEGTSHPPPPPALKPITSSSSPPSRTIVEKRMLSGGLIVSADVNEQSKSSETLTNSGPPSKKARTSAASRKALWKCKKCTFKHASKEIVVFHIRQYHKPKRGESVSILSKNHLTAVAIDDDMEEQLSQEDISKASFAKETHQYICDDDGIFSCKFCPFTTGTIGSMEAHAENHFSKPNCNFSCAYCSYSVPAKQELMVHMQLHGVFEQESEPSLDRLSTITLEETPPKPRGASASGPYKKYHCTECPYVTDSKGQFLYHKQFHRPRDTPFKCPQCSYNVSHKHLLHQHVRVHEKNGEIPGNTIINDEPNPKPSSSTNTNSAHPTCLVWRGGRPFRMYRCRVCPQVHGKVTDLIEHEATHGLTSAAATPSQNQKQQPTIFQDNVNTHNNNSNSSNNITQEKNALYLCDDCPARFFYEKELRIHHSFHRQLSAYRCQLCSYSARQETPHLLSHMKVHGKEYQVKTEQLLQRYPRAAKLNFDSSISINVSTSTISRAPTTSVQQQQRMKGASTIVCQKCPAKFHSPSAYQQHAAFHGVNSVYRCRYCDYSMDTLKNLTLHELLHAGSEITISEPMNLQVEKKPKDIPPQIQLAAAATVTSNNEFDEAYQGNPDFTYPTYVKNGRIKSKRYKCMKCPSAFEKRDQYKVHISLHGSSQRYKCGVCDYAVTYYANFIQHLKKHSTQADIPPELLIAKPLSKCKTESSNNSGKVTSTPVKKSLKCSKCNFTTVEKAALDEHRQIHIAEAAAAAALAKEKKQIHKCSFCDFACSRHNLLKDHVRLHFHVSPGEESSKTCTYVDDVNMYADEVGKKKASAQKEYSNGKSPKKVKVEPVDEPVECDDRKVSQSVANELEASETEGEGEGDEEEENEDNDIDAATQRVECSP